MPPFRLLLFPIQISAGKLLPCSCLCLPRHASAVQVSWHSASPAFGSRAPFGAFLLLFFSALPAFSFLQAPFASLALLRAFFLTLLLSFFLPLLFRLQALAAFLIPPASAALQAPFAFSAAPLFLFLPAPLFFSQILSGAALLPFFSALPLLFSARPALIFLFPASAFPSAALSAFFLPESCTGQGYGRAR